jgi:signal transduction histidine kinase
VLPALRILDAVTWNAGWTDYRGPATWLYVGTSRAVHEDIAGLSFAVTVVLVGAFLGLLIRHWRAQRRLDRVEVLPLASVAAAAATVAIVQAGGQVFDISLATTLVLERVERLTLLLLPASFAVVALTHRLSRGHAAAIILRVSGGTDVAPALRDALDDPLLQVLYDVDGTLTSSDGDPEDPISGRLEVPLHDLEGAHLGVLVVDPSLARHGDLLAAVTAAAALGITNARLRVVALAQLSEVRASRRRIAEAAVTTRKQLERDLHDGTQQRLLAVAAALSRARLTGGTMREEAMEESARGLRVAMAELRDLARGVHPAVLSQGGLGMALADVAAHCPVPVRTDVSVERFSAAVEETAYFLICEALSNVTKHAGASRVTVSVRPRDGNLVVRISDDGAGGATTDGHGLRGLSDRVAAIGGVLLVDSPPGGGTIVSATLPCT